MKSGPKAVALGSLCAVLALAATPATPHHSTAMYDKVNLITLDATIKEMQWRNPHVTIDFVNDPAPGQPQRTWTTEVSSPGVMTRAGWTKRSLNPGDKVKVEVAPLRDGRPGGEARKVTVVATGQVLTWSFRAGEASNLN
jgi:hypothetical protein